MPETAARLPTCLVLSRSSHPLLEVATTPQIVRGFHPSAPAAHRRLVPRPSVQRPCPHPAGSPQGTSTRFQPPVLSPGRRASRPHPLPGRPHPGRAPPSSGRAVSDVPTWLGTLPRPRSPLHSGGLGTPYSRGAYQGKDQASRGQRASGKLGGYPATAARSPEQVQGGRLGRPNRRGPRSRPGDSRGPTSVRTITEQLDPSARRSHETRRTASPRAGTQHRGGHRAPRTGGRAGQAGQRRDPGDPPGPAYPSAPPARRPGRTPARRTSRLRCGRARAPEGREKEDAGRRPRRRFSWSGNGQRALPLRLARHRLRGLQDGRRGGAESLQPFPLPARAPSCWRGCPLVGRDVSGGNTPCRAGAGASSGSGPG